MYTEALNILEQFGFYYLDESHYDWKSEYISYYEIKLEYIGNDIKFKQIRDFDSFHDYSLFILNQGKTIDKHLKKAINEVKKLKYHRNIEIEWDEDDYNCIYIRFYNNW